MKTYKEVAESVFERRDVYIAQKNKRIAALKKYTAAASSICILFAAGVGAWKAELFNISPKLKNSGNIITETASSFDERENQWGQSPSEEDKTKPQESSRKEPAAEENSEETTAAEKEAETDNAADNGEKPTENIEPLQNGSQPVTTTASSAEAVQTSTAVTATASIKDENTKPSGSTATTTADDWEEIPATTTVTVNSDVPMEGVTATTVSPDAEVGSGSQTTTTTVNTMLTVVTTGVTSTSTYSPMTGVTPTWDERTITQKFPQFYFGEDNTRYLMSSVKKNSDEIGEYLGTAEFVGYDNYNDKTYTTTARIFSLDGISAECALAVRYDGDNRYYLGRNLYYVPETLGQMLTDMMIADNISFGKVYEGYGPKVLCDDADDEVVWQMLLSDTSLVNEEKYGDSFAIGKKVLGISVNLPKLGRNNISLAVTDSGYITTNIVDRGASFYIGKDKTEAFINYIYENGTS